jgi:hypothetical protein
MTSAAIVVAHHVADASAPKGYVLRLTVAAVSRNVPLAGL